MKLKIAIGVSIIVIVVLLLKSYKNFYYVQSTIDSNWYFVRNNNVHSANSLAILHIRMSKLLEYLQESYRSNTFVYYFVPVLLEKYNKDMLSEAKIDSRYTTYTIDKKDINVCLRTRDANEHLYEIDLLMYVLLHELAHICNYDKNGIPIIGHGQEFINIFSLLVKSAIQCKVYNYTDYKKTPKEYCGIMLTSNIL